MTSRRTDLREIDERERERKKGRKRGKRGKYVVSCRVYICMCA